MRILLDTHILIWAVADPGRLDRKTADDLADGANEVLFSAASIWEIAIKYQLSRPDFAHDPARSPRRRSKPGLSSYRFTRQPRPQSRRRSTAC